MLNIRRRGVSKARNAGAQIAEGDLLLFLDADTLLDPHFITEMRKSFTGSNVVLVSGKMAGLEKLGIVDNLLNILHYNLVNKIAAFTARIGFPFFPTVCIACKKAVFKEILGFDEDLAIAEDLKFSLKMGKLGKSLVNGKAKAYTSLRRVKKNGRLKNYFMYFKNYFKVFVLNQKPWIREFPHTREI